MEFGKKANENVENGLLAPDEIVTAVLLGHFPVGSNINAHQQSSRDSDLAFSRCIHQWTSQTITSITDEAEFKNHNPQPQCPELTSYNKMPTWETSFAHIGSLILFIHYSLILLTFSSKNHAGTAKLRIRIYTPEKYSEQ